MRKFSKRATEVFLPLVVYLMSLPILYTFLKRLGILIQLSQGKGFGAGSLGREISEAAKLLNLPKESPITIFDVGANVGSYSEQALKLFPNATIYAFEPSKIAFEALAQRFKDNEQVVTLNFALSDSIGVANLYSDNPGSGLGSLTKRNLKHHKIDFEQVEEIQTTTLDAVSLQFRVTPNLIKIDVEGNELKVLSGAKNTLLLNPLIQFEFGGCNIDTRTYFRDFYYFFQNLNFEIFCITPFGRRRISRYTQNLECFETTNYLAIHHSPNL